MVEKVLNIMLIAMFVTFCVVFAVKTVLIDVAKEEEDRKWEEENKDLTTNYDTPYVLSIDSRYSK